MVTTSSSDRCPNPACSSAPEPDLARHGSFPTKRGRRSRRVCKRCGHTFSATRGTPYWRMRRPRADLDRALHMSVEGVSATGIARVLHVSVSTVTRWLDKAGAHAQAFSDEHVRIDRPVELQLDELNTYGLQQAANAWSFNAIEVWSRLWASQRVGRRTPRTKLLFVRQIAAVCGP